MVGFFVIDCLGLDVVVGVCMVSIVLMVVGVGLILV